MTLIEELTMNLREAVVKKVVYFLLGTIVVPVLGVSASTAPVGYGLVY